MSKSDEIKNDVQTVIDTLWNKRNGNKIPETSEVALAGGAVEIKATFLYADLANSSKTGVLPRFYGHFKEAS